MALVTVTVTVPAGAAQRSDSQTDQHRRDGHASEAIEKTVAEQGDMFTFVRYSRHRKVYGHLNMRADGQWLPNRDSPERAASFRRHGCPHRPY
jgi:hypothetical protein